MCSSCAASGTAAGRGRATACGCVAARWSRSGQRAACTHSCCTDTRAPAGAMLARRSGDALSGVRTRLTMPRHLEVGAVNTCRMRRTAPPTALPLLPASRCAVPAAPERTAVSPGCTTCAVAVRAPSAAPVTHSARATPMSPLTRWPAVWLALLLCASLTSSRSLPEYASRGTSYAVRASSGLAGVGVVISALRKLRRQR